MISAKGPRVPTLRLSIYIYIEPLSFSGPVDVFLADLSVLVSFRIFLIFVGLGSRRHRMDGAGFYCDWTLLCLLGKMF